MYDIPGIAGIHICKAIYICLFAAVLKALMAVILLNSKVNLPFDTPFNILN